MLAVIIAWVAYMYAFIRFLFHGLRIGGFFTTVLLLAAGFLSLVFWTFRVLSRPSKKQAQAAARLLKVPARAPAPAAEDSGSVTFRVAGTTFENEDGTSRQDILRHLKFGDAPWADGPEDLTATLEETEYEGEQAFAVFVNGYQVGNVPKASVRKVAVAQEHVATCYVSAVRILGGGRDQDGRDLSYGCEITLEY